ncbi:LysM peptidoglycan-binding domain-containing protein [Microvirga sp. STR05]|uniref:LysM peptidoglycan-binding domain-containing protein n=1 Tax=Hymenobacter duratus TaxID=2771356 RepID=A0ABR8JFZ6_9BACT|nr:LysM peptidoglycan-binding domain-containing protein [Hymenobacter duratus]MBD2714656.1 LysM peptidoglycan-binding domain-containing protein [Hymenobacter duratus]MBR7949560.1 LysM peptidoglycan-binding domain-containing protein [Microvirga sp. STR05]
MRFFFRVLSLGSLLLPLSLVGRAQQAPVGSGPALSEDSVRVMSGLVQTSVRQLRAIYNEPDDARATQLIETALQQMPAYNQRLSYYTASLPREQQQQLAKRLRQQPWQVELQTLLRSPQYRSFSARTAKNPDLRAAAERLQKSGFVGTTKPGSAVAAAAPASAAKPVVTSAAPVTNLVPAKPSEFTVSSARQHTVVKGETLFGIARHYKVKPADIQAWNSKSDNSVRVGEVLTIQQAN